MWFSEEELNKMFINEIVSKDNVDFLTVGEAIDKLEFDQIAIHIFDNETRVFNESLKVGYSYSNYMYYDKKDGHLKSDNGTDMIVGKNMYNNTKEKYIIVDV